MAPSAALTGARGGLFVVLRGRVLRAGVMALHPSAHPVDCIGRLQPYLDVDPEWGRQREQLRCSVIADHVYDDPAAGEPESTTFGG